MDERSDGVNIIPGGLKSWDHDFGRERGKEVMRESFIVEDKKLLV